MRFGNYRANLFVAELSGFGRIALGEHASGSRDLDYIGAVLDPFAHLGYGRGHAVGNGPAGEMKFRGQQAVIEVTAGDSDSGPGCVDARPGHVTGLDRVAQRYVRITARADVSYCRETGFQSPFRVLGSI